MGRGRKKIPTKVKQLQGTIKAERILDNEMTASLVANILSAFIVPCNCFTFVGIFFLPLPIFNSLMKAQF